MTDRKFETIGPDDPISMLAGQFSNPEHVLLLATSAGISRMEVAIAMANACGHILASSKDMTRDAALGRMDDLREVMQGAYDLYDTQGGRS